VLTGGRQFGENSAASAGGEIVFCETDKEGRGCRGDVLLTERGEKKMFAAGKKGIFGGKKGGEKSNICMPKSCSGRLGEASLQGKEGDCARVEKEKAAFITIGKKEGKCLCSERGEGEEKE